MKTIIVTYPDFQGLPRGLKQLLVASESFFFENIKPSTATVRRTDRPVWMAPKPVGGSYTTLARQLARRLNPVNAAQVATD